MGSFSLVILAITALALIFGALFGLLRGCNRSLLRLVLVVISVALAFLLRESFVQTFMNIETGEGTIKESIIASINTPDAPMPEGVINLVFGLVEIIMGVLVFYTVFFALKFLTWLIIFPIFKIFIKRGEKKRALLGGLFGLVQGLVIAVMICSPLSGLMVQINKLSQVQIDGAYIMEVPEEMGLDEYLNSSTYKFFDGVGGWVFDSLTTVKHQDGSVITINDTTDGIIVALGFSNSITLIGEGVSVMTDTNSAPQDKIHAMNKVGESLIALDDHVKNLKPASVDIVNAFMRSLADALASGDGEGAENDDEFKKLAAIFEKFNLENLDLVSASNLFFSFATYVQKTEYPSQDAFTQSEASIIVEGFAQNKFILDFISKAGDSVPKLIDVEVTQEYMFVEAINNTVLSTEDKDNLRLIVGIG